jgi:hypothetical protein
MTQETAPQPSGFLDGNGPFAGLVAAIILTLFSFSTALVPIRSDNDVWWHVKTGQYISENGIPQYDVFSYTAADHEWHNHEWLTQVIYWQVWNQAEKAGFGGWRGLILFNAVVLWITIMGGFLLAARLSRNWWAALLVGVLMVAIGRRLFSPRPPVVTNMLLIAELWLLIAVAEGWLRRRWILLLAPMIALWTNLHGGWLAAGVVFAAFLAEQFVAFFRTRMPRLPLEHPAQVLKPVPLMGVGFLLLLATLANPYGYHLYALPARVMSDRHLVSQIGELRPPDFYYVIDFELTFLLTIAFALFTRHRPRLFELLIYLFFLHQAIQHVRHLSLFSIMLVPLTARLLGAMITEARASLAEWQPPCRHRAPQRMAAPAVGALAVLLLLWVVINPREGGAISRLLTPATYPGRNVQYLSGMGYVRENFPSTVADFVELADVRGRMWNENNYAGYLIWRLAPERKVFSDSRFDIFGGDIMRAEQEIAMGNVGLLDRYDVQWVITRSTKVLSLILSEDGDWKLAAQWPEGWEVWIRDTAANAEMIERARSTAPLAGAHAP